MDLPCAKVKILDYHFLSKVDIVTPLGRIQTRILPDPYSCSSFVIKVIIYAKAQAHSSA